GAGAAPPPAIDLPATLEIAFLTADMGEMATWIRGVRRAGPRGVAITDDDPLRLFRTFVTIVALTRSVVER
ncbi:MAG: hypothetical protein WB557_01175, partial [Solirubrobacteraceae bacterium]